MGMVMVVVVVGQWQGHCERGVPAEAANQRSNQPSKAASQPTQQTGQRSNAHHARTHAQEKASVVLASWQQAETRIVDEAVGHPNRGGGGGHCAGRRRPPLPSVGGL